MSFDEYAFALKFRDIIQSMVNDKIEQLRPRVQYATVVGIDPQAHTCTVNYPGDFTAISINMGVIQPAMIGQTVRIGGLQGDRYVEDVIGLSLSKYMDHARESLTGGELRKVTSTAVGWGAGNSNRFIVMGAGRNTLCPSGYFDIEMPVDTTVISKHNAAVGSTTVAAGLIPLANWEALYYDLPLGGAATSNPSRFHIVGYTTDPVFEVPASWIFVCVRNNETGAGFVKWGDGSTTDWWRAATLGNSWANYGGVYNVASYTKTSDNFCCLQGLVKLGTPGTVFTLSVGFRPLGSLVYMGFAAPSGFARIDISNTGIVAISSYGAGGTNAYVSLEGIRFPLY